MKIAAITMVHGEYTLLERWCQHYGAMVGHENLYIFSHGNDPKHREIAHRSSVIAVPRDQLDYFEARRQSLLAQFQRGISNYYDVVMRSDTDELLFVDPEHYSSVHDCLEANPADAWYATGFDVFEEDNMAELSADKAVSSQRTLCRISSHQSKAVASKAPVVLKFHGALNPEKRGQHELVLPKGLYAAHLKFADRAIIDDGNEARRDVSRDRRRGGWANASKVTRQLYRALREVEPVDAEAELDAAHEGLAHDFAAHRKIRRAFVVPPYKTENYFRLPERWVGQF